MTHTPPFACNMAAFPAKQRAYDHALTKRLVGELATPVPAGPDAIALLVTADAFEDVTRLSLSSDSVARFFNFL